MIRFALSFLTLFASLSLNAETRSLLFGINHSYFNTKAETHPTYTPSIGFLFGFLYARDFAPAFSIRTGGYFTQRVTTIETPTANAHFNIGYIAVPLTAQWSATNTIQIFFGPVENIKTSSDCTGYMVICNADDVASANLQEVGLQAGFRYSISETWGAEVIYDYPLSENVGSDTRANAVSAATIIRF